MKTYVLSKYNVFKTINDTVVGVNLNNKVLFSLDFAKYAILEKYATNLELLKQKNSVFFNTMLKLGIITEPQLDSAVFKNLVINNRLAVFDSSNYRLTINPTLNCNFYCWYCYETHTKHYMNINTVDSVIKYIETTILNGSFKKFHLDWFGGEPLLCFEKVIKPISIAAQKLCIDNNIEFNSGITTNGYLISLSMIDDFKQFNMKSLQITLDGGKDIHNGIRFTKDKKGSYDKIVENICLLAKTYSPEDLTLRLNFTKESFEDLSSIINSFPTGLRPKIKVIFQQVWQDKSNNHRIEDTEKLKALFKDSGFKVDIHILNIKGYTCYADLYNQAVINYDGRVFKCTARNFEKEREDGYLTDDGRIIWHKDMLPAKLFKSTFDNKHCSECKYLPICYGPCSQKHSVIKNARDFKKYCYIGGIEDTLNYIMKEFAQNNKVVAPLLDFK